MISAKRCVILMCITLAVSCGPEVKTDLSCIRSGYEIHAPEALRRAQDDVRAKPEYNHPRFWAGFQLVGAL